MGVAAGKVGSRYQPTWDSLDTRPLPQWYVPPTCYVLMSRSSRVFLVESGSVMLPEPTLVPHPLAGCGEQTVNKSNGRPDGRRGSA